MTNLAAARMPGGAWGQHFDVPPCSGLACGPGQACTLPQSARLADSPGVGVRKRRAPSAGVGTGSGVLCDILTGSMTIHHSIIAVRSAGV